MLKEKFVLLKKSLSELSRNKLLLSNVEKAKNMMIHSIVNGGKILVCGNGGSATQASHMVGELIGRFNFDRPPLPAVSLFDLATTTAIGNDYGYNAIFSRFVNGIGEKNDVLFLISTSGNSENCLQAIFSAKKKSLKNITLLGRDGGKMAKLSDIAIVVPFEETPLIQEIHLTIIHHLCDMVEKSFFQKGGSK